MFKKKKTYIDKINFDVFENEPSDFDLFSKEEIDEDIYSEKEESDEDFDSDGEEDFDEDTEEKDEVKKDESVESGKEDTDNINIDKKDNEIEIDDKDVNDIDEEDIASDDLTEEESSFSYEDFDKIQNESDDKADKTEKPKKKKSKGKTALLTLLWFIVFGAGVVLFLYFQTDVFKKKKKDTATTTEIVTTTTEQTTETTEELDENFYTIYSYETNADVNINALMADYYDALVKGDSDKLKDIVTEPEAFGDMMIYETKAQVISEYSNITCYTIPGLNENEILVFTTSNVTITGVNSKPLDIKQFYVVKEGNNYKINNGVLSQEIIDYINVQAGSPDVQNLYKSVQDNINQCLAEDSTFAEFYNKINSDIEDSEE
ncbi:MAG: hypothetical protein IJ224_04910 [Lachnospiraceae bacterium]|nr:hypothetical protein [Lachnospiraceae bacterium]